MKPEKHSPFNLQEEITRYVSRLGREVSSKKKRKEVAREYSEHIEDAVYYRLLSGEDEKQAFDAVCEELGDATKIQELLAVVHNRDRLPAYIKYTVIALGTVLLFVSYYFIEDRTYRSWVSLVAALTAISVSVYLVCLAFKYIRALLIRRKSIRRLKGYAKDNGLRFSVNSSIYKSVFKKTDKPELIIESENARYIISLWASIGKSAMLRLLDCGLYMYSKRSGFVFYTGHRRYSSCMARPKGFEMFPLILASLENISSGMRLFPKISWQEYESREKKNINILLLNPVPLSVDAVKNGMLCNMNDGSDFLNMKIYSTTGLVSFLEGERISRRKNKWDE